MIRYVKLVSGVELIGEEVSDDGKELTLKLPMQIELMDQGGMVMCSLVTYCVGTSVISLNYRYILQHGEASDTFQQTYLRRQQFTDNVFEDAPEPTEFDVQNQDSEDDELQPPETPKHTLH